MSNVIAIEAKPTLWQRFVAWVADTYNKSEWYPFKKDKIELDEVVTVNSVGTITTINGDMFYDTIELSLYDAGKIQEYKIIDGVSIPIDNDRLIYTLIFEGNFGLLLILTDEERIYRPFTVQGVYNRLYVKDGNVYGVYDGRHYALPFKYTGNDKIINNSVENIHIDIKDWYKNEEVYCNKNTIFNFGAKRRW